MYNHHEKGRGPNLESVLADFMTYQANSKEGLSYLDDLLMQFKGTVDPMQQAFKRAETQIGKLVDDMTKVVVRREEEYAEIETHQESKDKGRLELSVEDQKISFDLFAAMKHPDMSDACFEEEESITYILSLTKFVRSCIHSFRIFYTSSAYNNPNELAKCAYWAKRVHLLGKNIHLPEEMASRKRKSIGARPIAQYDTRRFHSLDAWNRYTDNVLGRRILPKRKVEIYHTEFDDFKTELERRNLHKRLTNLADGTIDVAFVKEFYANLYSSEDPSPKQARVRGHLVKIDVDSLNTFLETPVVLEEGETLPTYSRKDLTTLVQVWSVLSYSNLAPTSHTSDLTADRASLTFERLSPTINLAYIRKNCWNIDDLTIAFRGARRARARPADIPSSSAAPTPTLTSTSAAPSVPAHVDSQRFEAMLQSIHQGQILLLQSLQVVAPPGSILLVEQFLERVAWPGAKPSLDREGEHPTTQARPETAATPERSLEATLEPPTPVADLSLPQHATDPCTPLLDKPEDQTTPALALNTSPPATPVLHLTDEEDAQTQDTQDLSQEF
ncbi:hypothetical protein GmHk_03G007180 [Glycine max]|nr:hypothetical protein GmHk_03G007180 [Glycine max]